MADMIEAGFADWQGSLLLWLTAPLLLGFLADLIFGDPHFLPHPVRLIGKAIEWSEGAARKLFPAGEKGQLAGGALVALWVMLLSLLVPFAILLAAYLFYPPLALLVQGVMCYQILAVRGLKTESMKVYKALKAIEVETGEAESLNRARHAVAMIVGRDTAELNPEQIAKAAVETVAENTADGTVAPMLYMTLGAAIGAIFGLPLWTAPLGFLYKAINTMDSMLGYKNDRYLYFGRTAARLDDLANFIPARLSAGFMILAAYVLGMNGKNAVRIFKRDRFNHASPNSAQTEAVCAGALGIQLAGDAYYFGKLYTKKTIGDALRPVEYEDIVRTNRLLYATAFLCLAICLLCLAAMGMAIAV